MSQMTRPSRLAIYVAQWWNTRSLIGRKFRGPRNGALCVTSRLINHKSSVLSLDEHNASHRATNFILKARKSLKTVKFWCNLSYFIARYLICLLCKRALQLFKKLFLAWFSKSFFFLRKNFFLKLLHLSANKKQIK